MNTGPDEEQILVVGMKVTRLQLMLLGLFVLGIAVMGALTAIYEESPLQIPFAVGFFVLGVWIIRRSKTDPAIPGDSA